ncbi:MAG: DUF6134 family protein [Steroidobacteraceae bacterium]
MDVDPPAQPPAALVFEASVDGRRIGTHRFEFEGDPREELRVHSLAQFTYKVLGVTLYRYRHEARETWRKGCVVALDSDTDDNGKKVTVRAALGDATLPRTGCTRAYAYWRPEWLIPPLLNPQTGVADELSITDVGSASEAKHKRLTGDAIRIDLRYGADGDWLQLESLTPEKRVLKYRRIAAQ